MLRHIPQPFDARRLHGGIRIQALGDRMGYDRLALFFQQIHQAALLSNQGVDLCGFVVEEGDDLRLLGQRREGRREITNKRIWNALLPTGPVHVRLANGTEVR